MNHLRNHFFLLGLMSLVATPVFADENTAVLPEKEEDIPVEFIPTLDTTISVGMRRLNNGPRVVFGNLGSFSQPAAATSEDYTKLGANFVNHFYTDGYVLADTLNAYERNASGTQLLSGDTYTNTSWISVRGTGVNSDVVTVYQAIPTAVSNVADGNGLYTPNTNTVQNPDGSITQVNTLTWASAGRFLAYDANRARNWGALNQTQINQKVVAQDPTLPVSGSNPLVTKAFVDMHSEGVRSAGAFLESDSSGSSGFDIAIERRLGKRGKLDWGVSAGCKFAYVNAKASGAFPAFLVRTTDSYELNTSYNGGLALTAIDQTQPGGNASNLDYRTLSGTQVYRYIDQTTAPGVYTTGGDASKATPINLTPGHTIWGTPTTVGVVTVHGNYQLKGAYLLSHIGPTFRYNFNDRWSVSGTFGLALAWSGTTFKATEYYNTWNDLPASLRPQYFDNSTEYHINESNETHKFTPGIYYDLNAEYWVTDRTAFYTGLTGQNMRKFNQNRLSGRTATVEMGKNAGWTLGIRTRF